MHPTVLITGASRGIGFALARIFLVNGYAVIGTSRSGRVSGITDTRFRVWPLDLADPVSIEHFANRFREAGISLHLLINNAGIGPDLDTQQPERASFQQTFDVNTTGTVFFTEQMCRFLEPQGKLINISSKMGSIAGCGSTDSVAYRMSKTALNMYTRILANRLSGRQSVAAIHPGWVRTTIAPGSIHGRLSPEESAGRIFEFVTRPFRNGIFWNVETQAECNW